VAAKDTVTRILITAKDEASGVFSSLQNNAGKVAAAVAGYFGIKLFGDSVREAEALDVQMRKLEGVIAATGGAAGLTATEIDEMARRLDEATTGSAAGFRDAAAQLLTFKSVGKDAFETTLLLAQDLADAGFGSVTSNAVQLGKALEDPVKGLTALTRSGVTFSAEQQNVIRSLMETGQQAEAQRLILEAVAGQVGGTAAAIGGGLTGALDLVNKRFTDLKEQLGAAVLPVFQNFNERLAELYKRLTDSGAVKTFGDAIGAAFQAASDAFFRFFDNFDLDAVIVKLQDWASTTKDTVQQWGQYLSTASDVAATAFNAIAAGVNTIKTTFFAAAGVVSDFASRLTGGFATVLESMANVVPRFRNAADEARAISDAFAASAETNYGKAAEALTDTADSAEKLRDSFGNLVGAEHEAETQTLQTSQAIEDTGTAAGLTAAQLDAMGESMEYVDGAARDAALGINEAARAATDAEGTLEDATDAAAALEQAYKDLGITSQAALEQTADKARTAFDTIRNAGSASSRDIQEAFQAYARAAIAANQGVVTETLKAEAQMLELKLEADDTGKVIVESMYKAAAMTDQVGNSATNATRAYRDLAGAAKEAADAVKEDRYGNTPNRQVSSRGARSRGTGVNPTTLAAQRGFVISSENEELFNDEYNRIMTEGLRLRSAREKRNPVGFNRDQYARDIRRITDQAIGGAINAVANAQKTAQAEPTVATFERASGTSASGVDNALSTLRKINDEYDRLTATASELVKKDFATRRQELSQQLRAAQGSNDANATKALEIAMRRLNALEDIKLQEAREREARTTPRTTSQQPGTGYNVNVNLGGRNRTIGTASDADARALVGLLQDLEART
jgi:hypothetical protein